MDVSVTLSPDTDFVFPCESPTSKKITPSFDQSCYANATMSGPSAVIQGVQDIFEGEALLEKDNRPGSTTGSLAVSVGGDVCDYYSWRVDWACRREQKSISADWLHHAIHWSFQFGSHRFRV